MRGLKRLTVWGNILLWPAVKVGAVIGMLHVIDWLLEIFAPVWRERWGIKMIMSLLSWQIWTIIGLAGLLILTLESAYRLITKKEEEYNVTYKGVEKRAIKAEEKLNTKIILSMQNCSYLEGHLYMKFSLCNDGYKSFTLETITIITTPKEHLLRIQNPSVCLENNYNNILSNEFISEISQQPVPERNLMYNPDDTDIIELKELFNLKQYLIANNIEHIKKMPLGLIMRVMDYKGLSYFIYYYPCCEIYIGEDREMSGSHIIHKPEEFILQEGESNISKTWQMSPK
jgi:hypothetical protein